jgi:hypothetical protein
MPASPDKVFYSYEPPLPIIKYPSRGDEIIKKGSGLSVRSLFAILEHHPLYLRGKAKGRKLLLKT